jgi:hypothetical protein
MSTWSSKLWVLIFTWWIPTVFDLKWHAKAVVSNHDCNFSIRTQCSKWIFSFFLHYGPSVSSVRYHTCLWDASSVFSSEEEGKRKQFPPVFLLTHNTVILCYYPRLLSVLHSDFSFTCRLQCVKSSKVVAVAMDHATKAYRWHESKISLGTRSRQMVNSVLWSLYIWEFPHIH